MAAIAQLPVVSMVTLFPTMEQTLGVVVVSVTGKPELAVALSTTGFALKVCVPGLAKEIVWLAWPPTLNVNTCCAVSALLVAVKVRLNGPPALGVP